jgi:hypothetical protein
MRRVGVILVASVLMGVVSVLAPSGPSGAAHGPDLRLNHIQVKGSHNSYHIEPAPELIDAFMAVDPTAFTLAYTHDPLPVQFEEQGVRQIELDVYHDPSAKYPPTGVGGFKVMHIEQVDMGSTCPLLTTCLQQLEDWSTANPRHVPITVLLEMKDTDDIPIPPVPDPIDAAALHALDDTIRTVFDDDQIVTPDFVRGVGRTGGADGTGTVYDNPNDAVTGFGWPRLEDVRGRVMFVLDNKRTEYVDGDPTLAGRVAFPPSVPGADDAAFLKLNDSVNDDIAEAVEAGYMVRTRADFPVETGLSGDATNREAALASGAQFISGDYLTPTAYERYDQTFADRYGQPFDPGRPAYETVVPGGTPARCNPLVAPVGCTSALIENLEATVPGAPTGVTTTAGPGVLFVAWTPPTSDGGLPIEGYIATADPGGLTCPGGFEDTSCAIDGLTDGIDYTVTVTATNAIGASAPSDPSTPLAPTRCGPSGTGPFLDVSPTSGFCGDIEWLVAEEITGGYDDDTFRPANAVTRGAMAAFLYRYAGSPDGNDPACTGTDFPDVPASHPFCGEIEWLADGEITGGFPDGTYRPSQPVSRQSMALFLYRFAGLPDGEDPTCAAAQFTDVPTTHPFCGEIEWLVAEGITEGFPDDTFRPTLPVSRQGMAAFLHRFDEAGLALG